ncbi:MAG: DUF6765 family protein, partial [Lentisphaeria bacterium]
MRETKLRNPLCGQNSETLSESWDNLGNFTNPFQFSSEYYDSELNLVYYNYRHYNPEIGRWMSREPLEEFGSINLYSFIKNNVFNTFDVLGLYGYDVHYEFEYLKAIESGRSSQEAQIIANGSWSADQGKFDAINGGLFHNLSTPFRLLGSLIGMESNDYTRYQRTLHGLNGLSGKQLECFRKCIGDLISDYDKNNDLYELGVANHALADTYSHLELNNSRKLYDNNHGIGHGFDGSKPDDVNLRQLLLSNYVVRSSSLLNKGLPYADFATSAYKKDGFQRGLDD